MLRKQTGVLLDHSRKGGQIIVDKIESIIILFPQFNKDLFSFFLTSTQASPYSLSLFCIRFFLARASFSLLSNQVLIAFPLFFFLLSLSSLYIGIICCDGYVWLLEIAHNRMQLCFNRLNQTLFSIESVLSRLLWPLRRLILYNSDDMNEMGMTDCKGIWMHKKITTETNNRSKRFGDTGFPNSYSSYKFK